VRACRKRKKYSIRRYRPFVVAEVRMADASRGEERTAAFRSLAKYLFGGNATGTKMQMTTPVISSSATMQFVLPVESVAEAPKPSSGSDVTLREVCERTSVARAVHPLHIIRERAC
jgi:SOUL heme-binding protein